MRRTSTDPNLEASNSGDDRFVEMIHHIERLYALVYALTGRLLEVESELYATRRATADEDLPRATDCDWITLKQAQFLTGMSASGVRKWISQGKIVAKKLGAVAECVEIR